MLKILEILMYFPAAIPIALAAPVDTQKQNFLHLSDEQIRMILKGCRLNKRQAQKKLYHFFYGYAMSFSLRYSSDYDNGVEITNNTFLKIYRDLKNCTTPDHTVSSFMTWLKKAVLHTCIDQIKKNNDKEIGTVVETARQTISDARESVEQMLHNKEIIKAIQQLSPRCKAVFNLYVIEGFSHAEIAQALDIAESTSKTDLHEARLHLEQLLKKGNMINYERT